MEMSQKSITQQEKVTLIETEIRQLGIVLNDAKTMQQKAQSELDQLKNLRLADFIKDGNNEENEQQILIIKNRLERFSEIIATAKKSIHTKHKELSIAIVELKNCMTEDAETHLNQIMFEIDTHLSELAPILERYYKGISEVNDLLDRDRALLLGYQNYFRDIELPMFLPAYDKALKHAHFNKSKLSYDGIKRQVHYSVPDDIEALVKICETSN